MLAFLISTVSVLASLGWPSFASFRAIESFDKTDDVQWLTYWVVYSFLSSLEFFVHGFLAQVPLYRTAKLLFILWLVLPQFNGAAYLYEEVVKPTLEKYGPQLERMGLGPKPGSVDKLGPISSHDVQHLRQLVDQHGMKALGQVMNDFYTGK
eukprot:jgi/Mesen1/10482/ME000083S09991